MHHVEKLTQCLNFDVIDMWRMWMFKLPAQQGLLFKWDFHHNHHNHAGSSEQHLPSLWCGGWAGLQCYWQAWNHSERGLWFLWNTNLLRYTLFSFLILSNFPACWEREKNCCRIYVYFPQIWISANAQTNESAFVVSWCRYFNNTRRMSKLMTEIKINPSKDFYNYKIEFAVKNEDSTSVSLFTVLTLNPYNVYKVNLFPQFSAYLLSCTWYNMVAKNL